MTTFRPRKQEVCTLNFNDKFIYELPLNEAKAREMAEIGAQQAETMQSLDPNDEKSLDKAYNYALDAIDAMLEAGAGADIMSIFEQPSLLDVADVINYIGEEYKVAYSELFKQAKQAGDIDRITAPARGRR